MSAWPWVIALSLHQAGIGVDVFDQSQELRELGIGINLLPHVVKELAGLGLLPALDEAGIHTRELIHMYRNGQVVWRELSGLNAGYEVPQIIVHCGKLHGVLLKAALARLGSDRLHTDRRLVDLSQKQGQVAAFLESRSGDRCELWATDPSEPAAFTRTPFSTRTRTASVERHHAVARLFNGRMFEFALTQPWIAKLRYLSVLLQISKPGPFLVVKAAFVLIKHLKCCNCS